MLFKNICICSKICLMGLLFLFVGCAKEKTPFQKMQDSITSANKMHDDISLKYHKELAVLNSENDQSKIKKQLKEFVVGKEYKQSVMGALFDDIRLPSENIRFHKYVDTLNNDIAKLKSKEKALLKKDFLIIGGQESVAGVEALASNVQLLGDKLFEIKSIVVACREFRDEQRYITQVDPMSSWRYVK
jgi:hypothetical protein